MARPIRGPGFAGSSRSPASARHARSPTGSAETSMSRLPRWFGTTIGTSRSSEPSLANSAGSPALTGGDTAVKSILIASHPSSSSRRLDARPQRMRSSPHSARSISDWVGREPTLEGPPDEASRTDRSTAARNASAEWLHHRLAASSTRSRSPCARRMRRERRGKFRKRRKPHLDPLGRDGIGDER